MDMGLVKVDWNRLSLREFREFSVKAADVDAQIGVMCRIVVALPDGEDPADPETYLSMGIEDWQALSNHVVEAREKAQSKS